MHSGVQVRLCVSDVKREALEKLPLIWGKNHPGPLGCTRLGLLVNHHHGDGGGVGGGMLWAADWIPMFKRLLKETGVRTCAQRLYCG